MTLHDVMFIECQVHLEDMVNAGVHCVKPEYIAIYLTDDPPPSAVLHYIPEVSQFTRYNKQYAVWYPE